MGTTVSTALDTTLEYINDQYTHLCPPPPSQPSQSPMADWDIDTCARMIEQQLVVITRDTTELEDKSSGDPMTTRPEGDVFEMNWLKPSMSLSKQEAYYVHSDEYSQKKMTMICERVQPVAGYYATKFTIRQVSTRDQGYGIFICFTRFSPAAL